MQPDFFYFSLKKGPLPPKRDGNYKNNVEEANFVNICQNFLNIKIIFHDILNPIDWLLIFFFGGGENQNIIRQHSLFLFGSLSYNYFERSLICVEFSFSFIQFQEVHKGWTTIDLNKLQ